jgi:hypothetical protein
VGRQPNRAKLFSQTLRVLHLSTSELRKTFQSMARHESRMTKQGELEDRYVFDDSSAIIVTDSGWGVEGETPWTWKAITFKHK